MTIANYTELQDEIVGMLHADGDTTVEGKAPLYIKLLEARLNRELRTKEMEATMASTALTSGAATLPTGFLAFKELRYDGSTTYTLQPRSLEWIRAQDNNASGNAQYFAVTGTQVVCWPPTGPIKGTYYTEIPDLATNSTNWLLTRYPDLYLFGSLVEGAFFTRDESLGMYAERTSALIESISRADQRDQFDGGVLAVRAR